METAASPPRRLGSLALALPRLSAALTLTLLVAVSVLVRALAGWHKATPSYFPDEYLYAELARSLAETGAPLVRGDGSGFPALLQPLLTAPLWLVGDVALSYHLVQVVATLAMSLAVVPVYLLARRLGLGTGVALLCAAFTLAVPDFLYASRVLAEPFAYPLALAAVAVGTLALARGGLRLQLLFLGLVAVTVFARVQFLALPIAYVVAVAVVGLRERALRGVLREQLVPLGVFGLGVVASVARPSFAGQYGAFLDVGVGLDFADRVGTNAFGLGYATGWLLVPGAVLGVYLALTKPRSREELSFGAVAGALVLALLAVAATYGDVGLIQERYFFYALPLVGLLFALYASRGWPHRRALALLAAATVALVALVPVTFATASTMKIQSPFLFAAFRLEQALESAGYGALVLAALVTALVVVMLLCSRRPAQGTAVTLGLATAFCALASLGAMALDLESTSNVRERFLPAERSWVDRAGLEDVALVHLFEATGDTYQQLFWNRSVTSLLLAPDLPTPDAYTVERVSVARDGTLLSGGRPVARPLVVDEWGGLVEFRDAVTVASAPTHRLVRPLGVLRLRFVAEGYFNDGWLGHTGAFRVWPSSSSEGVSGLISFRATPELATTLTIRGPDGRQVERLVPGRATLVTIPVCGPGPWTATFESSRGTWTGERAVSARATTPKWKGTPRACREVP